MNNLFKTTLLILGLLLTISIMWFYFYKPNSELIDKINDLQKKIVDRDTTINRLYEDIKNKKAEIIEKEKIIYKDGKLIIPPDYEQLKNNYIQISSMYETQKEIIFKLEEKSKSDDELIKELSLALDESKIKILQLSKRELFSSSIIAGTDLKSAEVSYQLLILEKIYVGIGGTSDLKAKFYVGVKL